jgi:hypothetical protein
VLWHLGEAVYLTRDGAANLPDDAFSQQVNVAQQVADWVGTNSDCAVRLRIDVSESTDQYPGSPFPTDKATLVAAAVAGDDGLIRVYPGNTDDESYCGLTTEPDPDADLGVSLFPDGDYWYDGCADGSTTPPTDPWFLLVVHEWLHQVYGSFGDWAPKAVQWPSHDVHGGCYVEPYKDQEYGCMVNPNYFRDLMTGNVVVNGHKKGITAADWRLLGRPSTHAQLFGTTYYGELHDFYGRAVASHKIRRYLAARKPGHEPKAGSSAYKPAGHCETNLHGSCAMPPLRRNGYTYSQVTVHGQTYRTATSYGRH